MDERPARWTPLTWALVLVVITLIGGVLRLGAPVARAQGLDVPPPLPALGAVVAEDPLMRPGVFRPDFCPTGRSSGRFVEDGYRLAVTGTCSNAGSSAGMYVPANGLVMRDGEIEFEVQGSGAADRAIVHLFVRMQAAGNGYQITWHPSRGIAELRRLRGGRGTSLATRSDLPTVALEGGVKLAVRALGPSIWLLVNGEPVLYAADPADDAIDAGAALAGLARAGDDDDAEVAVTWRNLRLSRLAEGEDARAPTLQSRPAAGAPPFVPPPGSPPAVGAVIYEEPMNAGEYAPYRLSLFAPFECPTGRGRSEFVSDGFRMETRGKCFETSQGVGIGQSWNMLVDIPDGELRFEFKVVKGWERSGITVGTRVQEKYADGQYRFALAPGLGLAGILKVDRGEHNLLSRRADVESILAPEGWNSVAVRMLGPRLWLLLNDRPVLTVEDHSISRGGFTIDLDRYGDPDDDEHLEVVFANFRVSEIKGAPKNRRPDSVFFVNLGR